MPGDRPPAALIDTLALVIAGRRETVQRALRGEIKRPEHWFERQRAVLADLEEIERILKRNVAASVGLGIKKNR